MPTIYCDENILVGFAGETQQYKARLVQRVAAHRLSLVFSSWHWVEIARHPDRATALSLADFAESFHPLWLLDRMSLERSEIADNFFSWLAVPYQKPAALVSMAEMVADLNQIPVQRVGNLRSRDFVAGWHDRPDLLTPLINAHRQNQTAFGWIRARVKRVLKGQKFVDEALVRALLPSRTPSGILINPQTQQAFAQQFDFRNSNCRTLLIETAASEDSWTFIGGFSWQSFIDRMHFIPALSSADVFVTNDRRLMRHIRRVQNHVIFPTAESIDRAEFEQRYA